MRGLPHGDSALFYAAAAPPSPSLGTLFRGVLRGLRKRAGPDPKGRGSHMARPSLAEATGHPNHHGQADSHMVHGSRTRAWTATTAERYGPTPSCPVTSKSPRHRYPHGWPALPQDLPDPCECRQSDKSRCRQDVWSGAAPGSRGSEGRTQDRQRQTCLQVEGARASVPGVAASPADPRPAGSALVRSSQSVWEGQASGQLCLLRVSLPQTFREQG